MSAPKKMKIEVWSDVMCPFCYIGKRHYETALASFEYKDDLELEWKSFQLDPSVPKDASSNPDIHQYLMKRKGMSYEQVLQMTKHVQASAAQAGLEFQFDKAVVANSFDAHRFIHLAKSKKRGDEAEEELFKSYFTEGADISNHEELITIGEKIGIEASETKSVLDSDKYSEEVEKEIFESQQLGVRGVPFFVFDRKYAVSGAQPPELLLETIQKSHEEWKQSQPNSLLNVSEGDSCDVDGNC